MSYSNSRYTPEQLIRAAAKFNGRYKRSAGLLMQFNIAVSALNDPDLDDGSRRVLGAIIKMSSLEDGQSSIDIAALSALTGLQQATVKNKLMRLRKQEYVFSTRFSLGQGQGSASFHYLNGMSDNEVEAYTAALEQAQAELGGHSGSDNIDIGSHPESDVMDLEVTQGVTLPIGSHSESDDKALEVTQRVTTTCARDKNITSSSLPKEREDTPPLVPPHVEKPEPAAAPKKASAKSRGTRLPDDWKLPRSWGVWAMESFVVERGDIVNQAEQFHDYWVARSGAGATKVDWFATWKNWVRSSADRAKWKRRSKKSAIAPELTEEPQRQSGLADFVSGEI